jgi:hypothetical protein
VQAALLYAGAVRHGTRQRMSVGTWDSLVTAGKLLPEMCGEGGGCPGQLLQSILNRRPEATCKSPAQSRYEVNMTAP